MNLPNPPPLQVTEVSKHFGSTVAVGDVSFDLADGELLVVVGPSGCGKSTLLRSVAGLETIDAGEIRIGGELVAGRRRHLDAEHRSVGLVFQDHALFPHLTVAENVGFGIRARGAERRDAVAHLLELLGLGHLGRRYPHEVSGGERQRVSLARAIAPKPRLLLLDEPFASLDPTRRAQVRTDIVDLLRAAETPAILVTHDQAEALAVGDRIAVMESGRVQQLDTPQAVYATPSNRFVAGFMGEASFLAIDDGGAAGPVTPLGPVPMLAAARPGSLVVLRPPDVDFTVDPAGDVVIEHAEYRGLGWLYELRLPTGERVLSSQPRSVVAPIGTRVEARLRLDHELAVVDGATTAPVDPGEGLPDAPMSGGPSALVEGR